MNSQRFLRAIGGTAGLQLLGLGLNFLLSVTLARSLDETAFGFYAFALSVVLLCGIPAQVGLPTLILRQVAQTAQSRDWGLLRGLLKWADLMVLGFGTLIAVMLIAAANQIWAENAARMSVMTVAASLIPLLGLVAIRVSILRGFHFPCLAQLPDQLIRPSVQFVLLAGIWLTLGSIQLEQAMLSYVLAAVAATLFGFAVLRHIRPQELVDAKPRFEASDWIKRLAPLSLFAGLRVAETHVSSVMLGNLSTMEDVAFYRVANQGAVLVSIGLTAVNLVLAPHIPRLYFGGQHSELQALITTSTRWTALFSFPVTILFVIFGNWILQVAFGEVYSSAYLVLVILCLGQWVNATMGSVVLVLNMTGNEQNTIPGVMLALVINGIIGLCLIPALGAVGAAIASSLALCAWNLLLVRTTFKKTGLNTTLFPISLLRRANF